MSNPARLRLAAACKFLVFAICLFIAVDGKPPMQASVPSITDVQQDDHLARLDDKTALSDREIETLRSEIRDLERSSAERTGEERIVGLVVSLLSGGGLILQLKKKKDD